eukprot:5804614-Prymnesium_polylepis.1
MTHLPGPFDREHARGAVVPHHRHRVDAHQRALPRSQLPHMATHPFLIWQPAPPSYGNPPLPHIATRPSLNGIPYLESCAVTHRTSRAMASEDDTPS